ncbi:MAG: iron-containing alcohol dehydrogenase [Bacteroidota bacterium]
MNFNFKTPKNILSAPGCASEAERYRNLKLNGPVLLVTDATLVKLGIADKVQVAMQEAGLEVILFDQVEPEPKVATVRNALERLSNQHVSSVVGLGGGSPMDIAKILALLLETPQPVEALYGVDNCKGDRLPLVLIPTTAGTGSEVTHVAVVTGDNGEKSPIVDAKLIGDVVLLDAALTVGLPDQVTAATGIDAMVHAMEAFTSGFKKNVISDQLAIQAFKLLYKNISEAVHHGSNLAARSNMLSGSMLAGLAFANATVGAVHALSYPLGTNFKIPHGESNALVMVPTMKFNALTAFPMYAELCRAVHPELEGETDKKAADYLLDRIAELIPSIGLNESLSPYGIRKADLEILTDGTLKQARLLSYNYREMQKEDIYDVFESIL